MEPKPKKPNTLLAKIDQCPPCLCRYVARKKKGRRPMTHMDIVRKSGLNLFMVSKLSTMRSWKGVRVEVVEAFSMACGVNLLRTRRLKDYLRRRKLSHIRKATPEQRKMFEQIISG